MNKLIPMLVIPALLCSGAVFSQTIIYLCPGQTIQLQAALAGSNLQWKTNRGNGFETLGNSATFSGTTSTTLTITDAPDSLAGYAFRCESDSGYSDLFNIRMQNNWIGGTSPFWEDAGNWGCGVVPDSLTDVVVKDALILVQSHVRVATLSLSKQASLTVAPGFTLYISSAGVPVRDFNLSDSDMAHLDSIGAAITPYQAPGEAAQQGFEVNTNDAPTPAQQKINAMIQQIKSKSNELAAKKLVAVPDKPDGSVTTTEIISPAQMGYVYRSGGKKYAPRALPSKAESNARHLKYNVYGVDCSGFIYQALSAAGFGSINADIFGTGTIVATVQKVLKETKEFQGIVLASKGKLDEDQLQDGDLILWSRHAGIYFLEGGVGKLYQSNGTATPKDDADQLKNLGPSRGTHPLVFDDAVNKKDKLGKIAYWGSGYKVYRFEPFEITAQQPAPPAPGKANTLSDNGITDTTAQLNGEILSDGGSALNQRGFLYSTNTKITPDFDNSIKAAEPAVLGPFTQTINHLLPGAAYVARAYATNPTDTAYSNTIAFKTNGQVDTVATLRLHGLWFAIFFGDNADSQNKLGLLQDLNFSPCPNLITNQYMTEKIHIVFNQDTTGSYGELEFDKYWSWNDQCELFEPTTKYDWVTRMAGWDYDHASRTINFRILDGMGQSTGDSARFTISSFSPDEMSGNFVVIEKGEPYNYGFIRLR